MKVFSEGSRNPVKSDGIYAGVDKRQAKTDDTKEMPKFVVILLSFRVVVEPQHEHVVRQETDSEHDDKRKHSFRHFLTCSYLPHLPLYFTRHIPRRQNQVVGHQDVEEADDGQRYRVVDEELSHDDGSRVERTPLFGKRVAYLEEGDVVVVLEDSDVRGDSGGAGAQHGQKPDRDGDHNGTARGAFAADGGVQFSHRVHDGEEPVRTQGCEGEHGHSDGDVLGYFGQFADEQTVRPGTESVNGGCEGNAS